MVQCLEACGGWCIKQSISYNFGFMYLAYISVLSLFLYFICVNYYYDIIKNVGISPDIMEKILYILPRFAFFILLGFIIANLFLLK